MLLKDFFERSGRVCAHHGASVHAIICDGLHSAVASLEKIQIHRRWRISLDKMCFQPKAFLF